MKIQTLKCEKSQGLLIAYTIVYMLLSNPFLCWIKLWKRNFDFKARTASIYNIINPFLFFFFKCRPDTKRMHKTRANCA